MSSNESSPAQMKVKESQQREAGAAGGESVAWLADVTAGLLSRQSIANPWVTQIDGEAWTVATNGHRLVALRGDYGFGPPHEKVPDLAPVLKAGSDGDSHLVDLVAFREFIGVAGDPETLPDCEKCKNTGSVDCSECNGLGYVEDVCSHCDSDYEKDCEECDEGKVGCGCAHDVAVRFGQDPIAVYGDSFNRRLFLLPLRHLTGNWATWRQKKERGAVALLDGGDWRLYVMPIRCDTLGRLATFPPAHTTTSAVQHSEAPHD